MVYYTSLFIAGLIAIMSLYWLYKLIAGAGRVFFRTNAASLSTDPTGHLDPKMPGMSSKEAPQSDLAGMQPAFLENPAPSGQADTEHIFREYHPSNTAASGTDLASFIRRKNARLQLEAGWQQNNCRPDRDDRCTIVSDAYKAPRKADMNTKTDGRPWGW